MSDWVLAIDFGTSSTAAAIADANGAELVEVGGVPRVPSVVAALDDGSLVAGDAAVRQLSVAPERVERAPKRRLGDRAVLLGDRPIAPTALAAAVLKLVADEAIRRRGGTAPRVVRLTHPASWASTRLEALQAAATQAGLPRCELLAEPVAAALHLSDERISIGVHVAVYDLGGGTFDAAVLRRTAGGFDLVGPPGGLDRVGGEDLDEKLLEHVGESIREQDPEAWERLRFSDERAWRRAAAALRTEVRVAKETLSAAPHTTVYVPAPVDLEVQVTRDELEALVLPDLERTVDELLATFERAGSPALHAIYLVGGGSRMPLVGRLVAERTGITPSTWGDPKASVALGAAVSRGVSAPPASVLPIPSQPTKRPADVSLPDPSATQESPNRRRRTPALVGAAMVAVAALVAGVALLSSGTDAKDKDAGPPVQVLSYTFATASDKTISSTRTWRLDPAGTTLTSATVLTNALAVPITRTAVEVVPKQVAPTVADVAFEPGFAVVQNDPAVRFQVRLAAKASRTLRWTRTLPAPVDAVAFNALAKAQGAAEDALLRQLTRLIPAAVLRAAPLVPFSTAVDPGPSLTPSPRPSPTGTDTGAPVPQVTETSARPRVTTQPPTTKAPTVQPNRAPMLSAISNRTANEKTLPAITAYGSDADGDRLTYSATGLPSGLAISASTGKVTGSIAYTAAGGTPRATGPVSIASRSFTVRVTVKDSEGATASRSFTLTVRDTHGAMPNFIGDYGDGGAGKPNISSISRPSNTCSNTDSTVPVDTIWRQGVAPGTIITYGVQITYWYRINGSCANTVPKGW